MVFIVRKGNPKNIETWDDLTKPRRRGHHPEPVHLRRRALERAWRLRRPDRARAADEEAGVEYLQDLFANVAVQDDSARKALQTFTGGKGDVLLGYENEAIFAQQKGQDARLRRARRRRS